MILTKSRNYERLIFQNIPRFKIEKLDIYTADKNKYEKLYYYFFSKENNKLFHAYSRSDTRYVKYIEKMRKDMTLLIGEDLLGTYRIQKGALTSGCPETIDIVFDKKCIDSVIYNSPISYRDMEVDMGKIDNIPFILYVLMILEMPQGIRKFIHMYHRCVYVRAGCLDIITPPKGKISKVFYNRAVARLSTENTCWLDWSRGVFHYIQ